MNNQDFVQSLHLPQANQQKILEAMEKYGENHWWEPNIDPREYAYYQLQEDILLGDFHHFHESVELLLGRPVWTHEFGISIGELRQEAERAWTYQVGVTSETERQERIAHSMDTLEKWAKEHGKQIIQVNIEEAQDGH